MKGPRGSDIIVFHTYCSPIEAILNSFYTTALVNFFSWNKAYALFPLPTFAHRKTYYLTEVETIKDSALAKYEQQGWRSQCTLRAGDVTQFHPIRPSRRISDQFSWIIPFDTNNVTCSTTPDHVLEYACFDIDKIKSSLGSRYTHYCIRAADYLSYVLKYRYTGGPTRIRRGFWRRLQRKLDLLTHLELEKIPQKALSPFYVRTLQPRSFWITASHPEEPEPPTNWTFFDDKIVQWYETWERQEDERVKDDEDAYLDGLAFLSDADGY